MNLQYIKQTSCPICGNTTIIKEWVETDCRDNLKIREHSYGGTWEHRQFACGQELEYVPNFHNTIARKSGNICTNNDEYKERIESEKNAQNEVLSFIDNLDINDVYKTRLYNSIKYIY